MAKPTAEELAHVFFRAYDPGWEWCDLDTITGNCFIAGMQAVIDSGMISVVDRSETHVIAPGKNSWFVSHPAYCTGGTECPVLLAIERAAPFLAHVTGAQRCETGRDGSLVVHFDPPETGEPGGSGGSVSSGGSPVSEALVPGRRWSVYLDFRDWWIGVYVGNRARYICPLPCLVIRRARKP